MKKYTPAYKIPSASLTDHKLLRHVRKTGKPMVISTGMSTMEQIRKAVGIIGEENLVIMHCTSTYPCEPEELNLRMIETLRKEFPITPLDIRDMRSALFLPQLRFRWAPAWWNVT